MPSRDDQREIRERGALIVRRHVQQIVDPSRLVLTYSEKVGNRWAAYNVRLDGDDGVCYIGVGGLGRKGKNENTLVSFKVEGEGRTYRSYDTFEEAERDTEFKTELLERVKELIGEGGRN